MGTYKPRIADSVLARKLAGKGAVLIEGPKWCGKTTTAEQQAKSVIYMDDPKKVKENLLKADLAPQELLEGEHPRLLDEWQIAPQLWDTIRFDVDHRPGNGHYILTGSSVPVEEEEDEEKQEENKRMRHSGTGRYGWVKMRPMALYESGESNGAISLKELFNAPEKIYAKSNLSREDLRAVLDEREKPHLGHLAIDIVEIFLRDRHPFGLFGGSRSGGVHQWFAGEQNVLATVLMLFHIRTKVLIIIELHIFLIAYKEFGAGRSLQYFGEMMFFAIFGVACVRENGTKCLFLRLARVATGFFKRQILYSPCATEQKIGNKRT